MKKLANLEGVKALSKMEQKSINGGASIEICSRCPNSCVQYFDGYGNVIGWTCFPPDME